MMLTIRSRLAFALWKRRFFKRLWGKFWRGCKLLVNLRMTIKHHNIFGLINMQITNIFAKVLLITFCCHAPVDHPFWGQSYPRGTGREVLSHKGYNGALADVWSSGVILYVLIVGYLPFNEMDLTTLYNQINKAEFSCPSWFPLGATSLIH